MNTVDQTEQLAQSPAVKAAVATIIANQWDYLPASEYAAAGLPESFGIVAFPDGVWLVDSRTIRDGKLARLSAVDIYADVRTEADKAANIQGFTEEFTMSAGAGEFPVLVKPETDFDSVFKAWCIDGQEYMLVNGWMCTFEQHGKIK